MSMTENISDVDWPGMLQQAKEKIVKALWALPGLAEGERELALKEILWEIQRLGERAQDSSVRRENAERINREENDLLRSLLGADENSLRTPHPKLRISKARQENGAWIGQLLEWLGQQGSQSDAEVRGNLARWVPEYRNE